MRIWSHLLKESLMENFFFVQCKVYTPASLPMKTPYFTGWKAGVVN